MLTDLLLLGLSAAFVVTAATSFLLAAVHMW
jgi:hypothetical protein